MCSRLQLWDLGDEPMFVRQDAEMRLTTHEMHAEEAGRVFAQLGEELCVMPHASGINSGRRNAAVALSQGLDRVGWGQMLVKKLMQHRTSQGTTCFEAQYDDSPAAVDLGALMMGRTPEKMEALKSLLTTAVPELAHAKFGGCGKLLGAYLGPGSTVLQFRAACSGTAEALRKQKAS